MSPYIAYMDPMGIWSICICPDMESTSAVPDLNYVFVLHGWKIVVIVSTSISVLQVKPTLANARKKNFIV